MTSNDLQTHLQFTGWASQRLLDAAATLSAEELTRDLKTAHGPVLSTLAHIYQADRIWLSRVQGEPRMTLTDPGEEHTLDVLRRDWPVLLERWVSALQDQDADRMVTFRNLKGVWFEHRLWQVVLHVVNHATYHRGQVAAMFRQLGKVPPGTDLINYYRSLG